MSKGARPDLLPFALPSAIGLPFHGLVTDGLLALEGDRTRAYPQPDLGDCHVVQHSKRATRNRTVTETASDTERGYNWHDYALICGRRRQLGGRELYEEFPETIPKDYHLYCDDDYTWLIETRVTGGYGTCSAEVWLKGLFGVFSDKTLTMTPRKLDEITWTVVNDEGGSLLFNPYCGGRTLRSWNKTGSTLLINVGSIERTVDNWRFLGIGGSENDTRGFAQHDLLTITISGNGSIVPGSVGTGITASIEHTKDAQDLTVRKTYTVTGNDLDPETPEEWVIDIETHTAFMVAPSGSIIKKVYTFYCVGIADTPNQDPETGIVPFSDAATATISWGPLSIETTYVFEGGRNMGNEYAGTLTIDGVDQEVDSAEEDFSLPLQTIGGLASSYILTDNCLAAKKYTGDWSIGGSGGHTTAPCAEFDLYDRRYTYDPMSGSFAYVADSSSVCYV